MWVSPPGSPGLMTASGISGGGFTSPVYRWGVSLQQVSPDLGFWSHASDVGWGAHLGLLTASGLWSLEEHLLSINTRELLGVRRGLLHFQSSLVGRTISVYCDNSTAVSYLRKEGGTKSPFLNFLAQGILHWAESLSIRLAPQFIPGSLNVLADSLSRPHQLPHTEWSLNPEVFRYISRLWPVQIDLFATSENRQCSIFFSPFRDPMAAGTDSFLQPWDGLQAFLLGPSFPEFWRNSGNLGGRSSPWWLRISLSDPSFLTSFTCRWPLRLLCLYVQTSCACLSLAAFTRVSTGCVFMPGNSPALHETCQVLFHCSLPGFLVAPPTFAQGLSTQVAGLQGLVPLSRSLGLSTFPV